MVGACTYRCFDKLQERAGSHQEGGRVRDTSEKDHRRKRGRAAHIALCHGLGHHRDHDGTTTDRTASHTGRTFAGVFFVVGWGGLEGNGIMAKILYLIREPRFVRTDEPLLQLPQTRIASYLFWQILGITITVGMSHTIAAIGFPVLITALIPLRWKFLPMIFNARELAIMDAPTADNDVVLASLGGKPRMPGATKDNDVETESPESGASGDGNGAVWCER